MLRWFRRQKPSSDERARNEVAPPAPPTDTVTPKPAEAGTTDPAKKKRRRGSRGGRNRKRTGSGAAAAQKAEPEAPEAEAEGRRTSRDPSGGRGSANSAQRAGARRRVARRFRLPSASC